MRLQLVKLHPGQRLICAGCGEWTSPIDSKGPPYADLNGPAFKAYYHSKCAQTKALDGRKYIEWVRS